MKNLKRVGLVLVILIGLFVIVGLFLPSEWHVERSIVIGAPSPVVFGLVNDLKKNADWSPWADLDPTVQTTYGEVSTGEGATSSWTSEESGNGTMTITRSVPHEVIEMKIDFGDMGTADSYWHFEPAGGGVRTTWGIRGDTGLDIPGRYFGLAMDSMVGPAYETGLAKLQKVAEALPATDSPADETAGPDEGEPGGSEG
jgi:hypothetical protein